MEEAKRSNLRHRPIGIGVQGLADTFCKMRLPFESEAAAALNRDIFETIYFGAVEASAEIAARDGPYETFSGSPASKGLLQFDLWNTSPPANSRWNWAELKAKVQASGMRNSLLMAPMPTATTAQILGNNESTEPFTSNMYNRRVLAGEFPVVNKYLLDDLMRLNLWTPELRNLLLAERGSVQNIPQIPQVSIVAERDVHLTCCRILRSFIKPCGRSNRSASSIRLRTEAFISASPSR